MSKIHLITFKECNHAKNKARLEKHVQKHAKKGKGEKCKVKSELPNLARVFIIQDADDELLEDLKNDLEIIDVEEDFVVDRPHMAQTTEWSHPLMDIGAFHSRGYTGFGVKVGYIDSGAAPHEDLVYAGKKNCYSTSVPADADYDGHGTKVAGIIASRNNSLGYVGVAPDCLLYAVKADNNAGSGMYISAQIDGVEWLVSQGVKIISCSYGSTTDSSSRRAAFEDAYRQNGVLFICSAGNEGDNYPIENIAPHYPSDYDFVISVACLKENKEPANYSSRGPKVDIAAPADEIMTTVPSDSNKNGMDYSTPSTKYGSFNGTSCAAPHIAGLAALYKQMYPNYTADQLRNLILTNKEDLGREGTDIVFGAGMAISPWTFRETYTGKLTSTATNLVGSINETISNGEAKHFKFIPTVSGEYEFNTISQLDLFMRLYDSNYYLIDYNDDADSTNPKIVATLTVGQTYYINIAGLRDGVTGSYTLTVTNRTSSGGTAGESFDNPILVTGTSSSGTIPSGGDIYFKYAPLKTGMYSLALATSFDSYLELYSSDKVTRLTYNDDGNGNGQPKIEFNLTSGQTYYLKAFGYNHNTAYYGPCVLNISTSSVGTTITETFESNTLSIPFTGDWVRVTTSPQSGSYCYRNADIHDNGISQTSFKVNAPNGGNLSFYYRTDSEHNYDKFTVTAGGSNIVNGVSGLNGSWTSVNYVLQTGTTEITFKYTKDGSSSPGTDSVYIDQVIVEGTGISLSAGSGSGALPGVATVTVGSATSSSLTLSMSASGATNFNVYRSTSFAGSYTQIATGVNSPYTNTGLASNTTYYYKVAGVNSFGTGPQSAYANATTNNSGGVTPTTIVEDFTDGNFDPRLNLSLGGWEYDSTVGSISTTVADSTGPKSVTLQVDIPSGTTSRTLKLDHKGMVFGGSGVYHTQVFVNGVLKHTFTESDVQWRTQTINLGTGYQAIEIRASSTSSTWVAGIDNIVVSWR